MSYKSQFAGGQVWNGSAWLPVHARDLDDEGLQQTLRAAAAASMAADASHFPLDDEPTGPAEPDEPELPRRR
jgi:hypothetical protein